MAKRLILTDGLFVCFFLSFEVLEVSFSVFRILAEV